MSAKRNVLSTLGICRNIADTVEKAYAGNNRKSKTIDKMIDDLKIACADAFKHFPYTVTASDLEKIRRKYEEVKNRAIHDEIDIVMYCSLAIGLVTDLMSHITDRQRRKALNSLLTKVKRIQWYFDRNSDKEDFYEHAYEVSKIFHEVQI